MMNLRCVIVYITVLLTWLPAITAATGVTAGSSFSFSFTRVIGFTLRGRTVSEIEVASQVNCRKKCSTIKNCKSVNLISIAEGKFLCQLNDAIEGNSPAAQFVPSTGGDYFELKDKRACSQPGSCDVTPDDVYAFNHSHYIFVATLMGWADARAFCLQKNGDLASIHSAEERDFLRDMAYQLNGERSFHWIGLNDLVNEGDYVWSDGSALVFFENVDSGLDNYHSAEDCVTIHDGLFSDQICTHQESFVCKLHE